MTPVELVLTVARATLGASEVPSGTNAGPFVERCLAVTGNGKGDPWCASFVAMVGQTAFGKRWPVPLTASCLAVSGWAAQARCRLAPSEGARVGDLFLLWYGGKLNRHAHIGFVLAVNPDGSIVTIEGNTSKPGDTDPARSREGWLVASKTRKLGAKDRLVRWTQLLVD